MSVPPTIQIQTDIDLNIEPLEFLAFNYKGDAQYYDTSALTRLTSGILPVVVFPSISPQNDKNEWPPFFFTLHGSESAPSTDPTRPYNDGRTPKGWEPLFQYVNRGLSLVTFLGEKGGLLPLSNFMRSSSQEKTVSLFCGLYRNERPPKFIACFPVGESLTFYVITVQVLSV